MPPSILDSTEVQLQNAQAKITYLGEQTKPISTVVFHTPKHEVVIQDFARLHRTGELYVNDRLPYTKSFVVSPSEFLNILRSLKRILDEPAGAQGVDFLSFSVIWEKGQYTKGQEYRIDRTLGKEFLLIIFKALNKDNEPGLQILRRHMKDIFPETDMNVK
ncbi:MAG TPA: hypothetical protein VF173_23300 [Thermoanaerobaculia bacterium]|nr:hypothetical protein [Thermoanaerobaculia bacterium]